MPCTLPPLAKLLLGVTTTLVSMVLGFVAWNEWSEETSEFNSVTASWQKGAIFEAIVVNATGCPTNFVGIEDFDDYSFRYDVCDCNNPSAQFKYDTTAECQSRNTINPAANRQCNHTANAATEEIAMRQWTDQSTICVRREAEQNAVNRKRAPNGQCGSNFKSCFGDSCIPDTLDCPFSDFEVKALATANSEAAADPTNKVAVRLGNSNEAMLFTRLRKAPLADLSVTKGNSEFNNFVVVDSLNAVEYTQANGQYNDLVNNKNHNPSTSENWVLSARTEIAWKEDCPQDRTAVINVSDKVDVISNALLAQFLISIVVGIFNLIAVCLIYRQETDDDPNNDKAFARTKAICNVVGECIVFVPTMVATIVSYLSKSFFQSIADEDCSDAATNDSFQFLSDQLSKIGGINIVKLSLATLYLIYKIYKLCKPDEDDQDINQMQVSEAIKDEDL